MTNISGIILNMEENKDNMGPPPDCKVRCYDCGWKGIISECIILQDQETWEMPIYNYWACPECEEPIDV